MSTIQRLQALPPRILFSQRSAAGIVMGIGAFFVNHGWTPPLAGRIMRQFFFGVDEVRLRV